MSQLVIIAGGKGVRLAARIGGLPKALAPAGGRPLLHYQLALAARHGFGDVVILTGHGAAAIEDFCGSGARWGLRVRCVKETDPLGTAGALLSAARAGALADRFLVLYGDTMVNFDLRRFFDGHHADVTLFVHPNDHPHDSDIVEVDAQSGVVAFHSYPHPAGVWLPNLVNAAAYVVSRGPFLDYSTGFDKGDCARDLFPRMLAAGARIAAYKTPEYIKDAGTPERLDRVDADIARGRVAMSSAPDGFPAIFLDRDGTLTRGTGLVKRPDQLELFEDSAKAVRLINESGRVAVAVTNQPVVARGDCTLQELAQIHRKMEGELGCEHAYLDGIYACIHHPDKGYPGERPELKFDCDCRKPKTGLFDRAAAELRIDRKRSWMIGDSTMDIQAAHNAGLRSALLRTGNGGADGRYAAAPDFTANGILEAVKAILNDY